MQKPRSDAGRGNGFVLGGAMRGRERPHITALEGKTVGGGALAAGRVGPRGFWSARGYLLTEESGTASRAGGTWERGAPGGGTYTPQMSRA